jgi:hypothetical protein
MKPAVPLHLTAFRPRVAVISVTTFSGDDGGDLLGLLPAVDEGEKSRFRLSRQKLEEGETSERRSDFLGGTTNRRSASSTR